MQKPKKLNSYQKAKKEQFQQSKRKKEDRATVQLPREMVSGEKLKVP